jgi:L-lactate dehydrogenase (cytochrome)
MFLKQCQNIAEFRERARRRLPASVFDFVDGGADDEWALRNNTAAFDQYELLPRCLVDVSVIDLRTRLLGCELSMPLVLSPAAWARLFHRDKELGVARAADRHGVMFSLSTLATTSIEQIAGATTAPKMFQIYLHKDRGLTRELVERCRASGFHAICLTVDTPVAGNRERDARTKITMPPTLTLRSLLGFATRPIWSAGFLVNPGAKVANIAHHMDRSLLGAVSASHYINSQFDRTATWKDAVWLAELWNGPFVIKGLQAPDDARRAIDVGATAIMISNHGGRQLDGTPAPVDCIRPIRDAVGRALELIVDGGIRRGSHILRALALGADACAFGRPYIYSLAADGQRGVERLLELMREELERDLALLGCPSAREIDERYLNGTTNLRNMPIATLCTVGRSEHQST